MSKRKRNFITFSSRKHTTRRNRSIDYSKREYLPNKKYSNGNENFSEQKLMK